MTVRCSAATVWPIVFRRWIWLFLFTACSSGTEGLPSRDARVTMPDPDSGVVIVPDLGTPDRGVSIDSGVWPDATPPPPPDSGLSSDSGVTIPCRLIATPGALDFGRLLNGTTTRREVIVENLGPGPCEYSAAFEAGSSQDFGNLQLEQPLRISPGERRRVSVDYAPRFDGEHSGAIAIGADDPFDPLPRVALIGSSRSFALLISPSPIHFGAIEPACATDPRTATIRNTGTAPAVIQSVRMANVQPAFSASLARATPITLLPGENVLLEVRLVSRNSGDFFDEVLIEVRQNNQTSSYHVPVDAHVAMGARQVDETIQQGGATDVLFVLDDSPGTIADEQQLIANFDAFLAFPAIANIDYHIGVTTTDADARFNGPAGRLVPVSADPASRIVTPSSQPSPLDRFAINAQVGDRGSGLEQGLLAARLALMGDPRFTNDAGFIRHDARLAVVVVSDEEDGSPGSIDDYLAIYQAVKGSDRASDFIFSTITGDTPAGCQSPQIIASAGARYIALAERTGGTFGSICSTDWRSMLEELSLAAFGVRSSFVLSFEPVISTIEVSVDGTIVPAIMPNGTMVWRYDPASRRVIFTPFATPNPGARVRISYLVACS